MMDTRELVGRKVWLCWAVRSGMSSVPCGPAHPHEGWACGWYWDAMPEPCEDVA